MKEEPNKLIPLDKLPKVNIKEELNNLTQHKFKQDAKTFLQETKAGLNNKNTYAQEEAMERAELVVSKMALLILKQDILNTASLKNMNVVEMFHKGVLDKGNSYNAVRNLDTGNDSFILNSFVPTKVTQPLVESYLLNMYKLDASGERVLDTNSRQFKKPITITREQWIPYFVSGNLETFISKITASLVRGFKQRIYNEIMTLITDKTKYAFQKVGTATNMFDALATEVFPEIANMSLDSSTYNISGTSKMINVMEKEDLVMLVSLKNKQRLQSGILTQLFNTKYLELESLILPENIITPTNKFVIGDSDTVTTVSNVPYIDDNTIIVLSKKALALMTQIDESTSQQYTENLAIQLNLHVWYAFGLLPFEQGMVYTNPNLSVQPGNELPVAKSVEDTSSRKFKKGK